MYNRALITVFLRYRGDALVRVTITTRVIDELTINITVIIRVMNAAEPLFRMYARDCSAAKKRFTRGNRYDNNI